MGKIAIKKPEWIKFSIPGGAGYTRLKKIITEKNLHTVCLEARCPNMGECFAAGTATFLAMGNVCTRTCRYCSVGKGTPEPPDAMEPEKIARAVSDLGLRFAVITSVTRDDLPDGGASIFAEIIHCIRKNVSHCGIEVLVPDFGSFMASSIEKVIQACPDIINHNIEVAASFFNRLRPGGDYLRSLRLLKQVAASGVPAKTGLMIGFGETMEDIEKTIRDLCESGCSMLTVGQYLKSNRSGYDVVKYYHPDEFTMIREYAQNLGLKQVLSGPLVRSSYHALEQSLPSHKGDRSFQCDSAY